MVEATARRRRGVVAAVDDEDDARATTDGCIRDERESVCDAYVNIYLVYSASDVGAGKKSAPDLAPETPFSSLRSPLNRTVAWPLSLNLAFDSPRFKHQVATKLRHIHARPFFP